MKVAIIGGGVMGEAILAGALDRGVFEAGHVTVCDVVERRREQIRGEYRVAVTESSTEAMTGADLVVMSVKPQDLGSVEGALRPEAVLMSVMAGVRMQTLCDAFKHERVVRVMPNTPAAARAGMSVWTATDAVDASQRQFAGTLLSAIGREIYVDSETKLDMATAVSGSGPGYVFLFIEAMIEGAVAVGLPRTQAEEMVLQTVLGSALYAQESGKPASELRAMVTSPAGTTAAGLSELERAAFRGAVIDCVRAAFERSVELGQS